MSTKSNQTKQRRAVISFTGGKDCHLALCRALEDDTLNVVGLVCFHPPNQNFRAHPLAIQELQAQALELPFWKYEISGNDYEKGYQDAITKLHMEHDISVIVTGDMDLIGNSTENFMTKVCNAVNNNNNNCVTCWLPLWQMDREKVLNEMIYDRKFTIWFSCVKSPHFDANWIGRKLDETAIQEMKNMSTTTKLDLGGENGEYHTLVLDGPMYKNYRLAATSTVVVAKELFNNVGQPEGERWWVINTDNTDDQPLLQIVPKE